MYQSKSVPVSAPAKNIVDTANSPGTFNLLLKNTTKLAAALAFVGLTVAGSPSHANDVQTEAVGYKDLDLTWTEGAAVLYGRIKTAAHHVCNSDGNGELRVIGETKACVNKAMADAITQVNHPMLTQYYFTRTGKTAPTFVAESR